MRNVMASSELIDEAMAHPFYSPDEKAIFEQQEPKRDAIPIPRQSTRRDHPPNAMDRKTCRASSVKEAGSKNRNAKRRSSIACNRCRKRKIKCSGENDKGLACTNCRSAGNTNCHFVRVNSKVLQTKFPEWPYSAMGVAVSPTSRLDMYTPHMDSKSAALSNARVVPHSGFINYDMGAMGSCNASQGLFDYYGTRSAKGWDTCFNFSKNPSETTIFPEQVASNPLAQAYSYMPPGQRAIRSDIPSLVAGSLPDGQGIDRTPPDPATRAQLQTDFPALTSPPEGISNLSFSPEYRTYNNNDPWETKYAPTETTHHRGSISEPFSASSPEQRVKPDPDMVMGFMPMTPPNDNTATFTGLDAVDSATADDFRIPFSPFSRPFSRDSNSNSRLLSVSAASAASSDYSHPERSYDYSNVSVSESGRTRASDASNTLVNGLPSHLLPPAETQQTLDY